jgi:hypothetical protein
MDEFETEYQKWLARHLSKRKGESLRRLKERHGFGERLMLEQIWWPVVGNFNYLHPEYEFVDVDGDYYYMDLAYVRYPKPTDLESDSFSKHARDADRWSFSKGRRRQNSIALAQWNVLRFSIDDIQGDLDYCRKTLRRMLAEWYGEESESWRGLSLHKREILRLAARSGRPITPTEVCGHIEKEEKYARRLLHELVNENYLEAASGIKRIKSYRPKISNKERGRENR